MVWSIGVPRPSQVTVCVRGPAHPGPDHPHDGCRRRGRERGNPACPTPFGTGAPSMRSLTLGVEERYVVVLGARDGVKGERAARELDPSGDRIVPCRLDVADPDVVRAAAGWIDDRFGRVDVLVNNAAIDYDTDQRAVTADLDRVRRAMETNMYGGWAMVQAPY